MIKVDIKLGNKSWELKEALNLNSFDHDQFNSAIKRIQKQTNGILTQLVEEESSTGDNKESSESESGTDEDGDSEPKEKRKKL